MLRGSVLIIDDDHASLCALQNAFIRRGWEVAMFTREADGLAALAEYHPDWVLAAWEQLGGSGARFIRQVRARGAGIRVSLLTDGGPLSRTFLRGLKPDLTFPKPLDPEFVFSMCEATLAGTMPVGGQAV